MHIYRPFSRGSRVDRADWTMPCSKFVSTAIANAMRGVEVANRRHLYGVFGDAQWTKPDRLRDELFRDGESLS